jgi:hypothetical protein
MSWNRKVSRQGGGGRSPRLSGIFKRGGGGERRAVVVG